VSGEPGPDVAGWLVSATVVEARVTTCATDGEVLAPSSDVALKYAATAPVPTGSAVVVRVATPSTRVALPTAVPLAEKVTTPAGAAVAGATAATVAASVTLSPDTEAAGAARLVVCCPA
jgi:hypothetical protein